MSAIQRHLMIMLVQVIIYVFSRPLPIIVPTPGGLSPSLSPPSTSITNSLALVDKNTGNIVKTVPLDLLNQEHGQAFILGLHEPRREIIHQSPHSSSLPIDIPSSSSSPFHKSKSAPLQFSASAPGSPSTLVISSLNEVGAEFINKFNMSAKARKRFQNLQRAIETGRQSSLSSSTSSSPRTIRHLEKLDSLDMITTETKRVVSDVSSGVSTGIQVTSGAVGG